MLPGFSVLTKRFGNATESFLLWLNPWTSDYAPLVERHEIMF